MLSLEVLLCDDRVLAAGWREPEELCDLALCDGFEADLPEADEDSLLTAGAFCCEDDLLTVLLLTAGADFLSVFVLCCDEDLVSVLLFTAGADLFSVLVFCCDEDLVSVLLFTAGADLLALPVLVSDADLAAGLWLPVVAWRLTVPSEFRSLPFWIAVLLSLTTGVLSAVLLAWFGFALVKRASPSRLCSGREYVFL